MNLNVCAVCNHEQSFHFGAKLDRCVNKQDNGRPCFCGGFVTGSLLTDAGGELHLTAEQQFRERMLMIAATSISCGRLASYEVDNHAIRLSQIADKLGKYVLKGEC